MTLYNPATPTQLNTIVEKAHSLSLKIGVGTEVDLEGHRAIGVLDEVDLRVGKEPMMHHHCLVYRDKDGIVGLALYPTEGMVTHYATTQSKHKRKGTLPEEDLARLAEQLHDHTKRLL